MIIMGSKAFLGYPRLVIQQGATAGWIIVLIGGFVAIAFWLIITALLAKYPGKSLLAITETMAGPYFGRAFNLLLFIYIFVSIALSLRQSSDAVILTALPETPVSVVAFLFIAVVWIAAHTGLEAITRSAYIAFPFLLGGVLAVLLSLYPYYNSNEIYPLLGSGIKQLIKYGLLNFSAFSEVIILAILVPFFSFGTHKLRKIGVFSILLVMTVFIMITTVYLMVIPMPAAAESMAPFYQIARTIYLGRYYQRLESVFILFWTFTAFLRLAGGFITAAIIAAHIFKAPYIKPLYPALIVLLLSIALTPANLAGTIAFEKDFWNYFGGVSVFLIPAVIWTISLWKGKESE